MDKVRFNQRGALGSKEKEPKIVFGGPSMVDLTPPRSKEEKQKRDLTRRWTLIVIAAALVIVLAILAGLGLRFLAKSSYNSEVESQAAVTAEIAEYKEVEDALTTKTDLETKLETALASQAKWDEAVRKTQDALPNGVQLSDYSAIAGGTPGRDARVVVVAQITSEAPITYSEVLYIFSNIENVTDVTIGDLSSQAEQLENGGEIRSYNYAVSFALDESAFVNFVEETLETETQDAQ